jgi:hypothetical protein
VARLRADAGATYTVTLNGVDAGLAKQPVPPNAKWVDRGATANVVLDTPFTLAAASTTDLENLTLLVGFSAST